MAQYRLSDPFRRDSLPSFEALRRGLDELFAHVGSTSLAGAGAHPPVNLYETAEGYVLTSELPGLSSDGVEVSTDGNRVTIRGERRIERPHDASVHRLERRAGVFRRSFELPKDVDATKAQATYRNGVLMVRIPRSEKAQPRRIAVEGS